MRTVGNIVVILGVLTLVLGCGGPLLLALIKILTKSDAFGTSIMIGMVIGLPALIIGGILVLVGAVLATTARKASLASNDPEKSGLIKAYVPPGATAPNKSRYAKVAPPESRPARSHTEDDLRAALTQSAASPLKNVVLALRVRALGLLAWFFVPGAIWNVWIFGMMGGDNFGCLAFSMVKDFVPALILPLILWLLSNVIIMRTGRMGPRLA